jgi:hypothetical protein
MNAFREYSRNRAFKKDAVILKLPQGYSGASHFHLFLFCALSVTRHIHSFIHSFIQGTPLDERRRISYVGAAHGTILSLGMKDFYTGLKSNQITLVLRYQLQEFFAIVG